MPGPLSSFSRFFSRRWRGDVPIRFLFWFDLALVGTLVNVFFTGAAFAMIASGVNIALAAAVHFLPLPYNVFLVATVWRLPAHGVYRFAAAGWLAFVTLV